MKTTHEIVNNSGYPLQIHLEEQIKQTFARHNWTVLAKEHRWVNGEDNTDGYIDLILQKRGFDLRLVVECKRINGSWTFLVPTKNPVAKQPLKLLKARHLPPNFTWEFLHILPESFESSFCVMETEGQKDNRTLEKILGDLLLSLEYLAVEETKIFTPVLQKLDPSMSNSESKMFYLPLVVTTAQLQIIEFDPSNIDVKTGKIDVTDSKITPIDFIRFTKNLTTSITQDNGKHYTLADTNRANDRTALIVHAESFVTFLEAIDA